MLRYLLMIGLTLVHVAGELRADAIRLSDVGVIADDGKDDAAAIQAAIDRSPRGATIVFDNGTYDISRTLLFRTGRTYRGEDGATLRFQLPHETYGIAIEGDASDVTIERLDLVGGGIRLTDGSKYTDIRILDNTISRLPPRTRGVYATIDSVGLMVEGNTFRDYPEWGAIIYHTDRGSFSHNTFCEISQGAQIVNPYDDVKVCSNRGSRLHRMGIEIQQFTSDGRPCRNLVVEGNVFTDWREPYWDSFGLSVMPQNGEGVRIVNNYLVATHRGPWGKRDDSGKNRYGYGIEAGFRSGVVEGNIVAGPWANHVAVSMPKTLVRNNRFFGRPSWKKYVIGEPGLMGVGSAVEQDNSVDPSMKRVPPPPEPPTAPADSAR